MTAPGLEIIDLTEIVGRLEIPCDFADMPDCRDEPAKWVLHRNKCCPDVPPAALACESCKEGRLLDRYALECRWCGFIWEHAPEAYCYIEPLERRS